MSYTQEVYEGVVARNSHQPEFLQAVREVLTTIDPVFEQHPEFQAAAVLERLVEPERSVAFRVPWVTDEGKVVVNRGYRIQYSSTLGPYKGGLRFHRSVNMSVMKFLGFEQIFKNSLTGLPMGGGKGGSDFDPKGKSDGEVMRFCQSFMTELARHIGSETDVPAGDIGVGAREIGYLFGQYKRLQNRFTGVLTGKGLAWGGSLVRPEATGFGAVYFAQEMLHALGESLEGKRCVISGSGNVAQYTAAKLIELGAIPVTMSDSSGYIYDQEGITRERLAWIMELKNTRRGRIREYAREFGVPFCENERPWGVPAQLAFPSATQNEIDASDAKCLANNGCLAVVEGANMPSTIEAIEVFGAAGVLLGPAKAANAGGVATSGLEMSQNATRLAWSFEEVDARLHKIMRSIYHDVSSAAARYATPKDLVSGANIAGLLKVGSAMVEQGVV